MQIMDFSVFRLSFSILRIRCFLRSTVFFFGYILIFPSSDLRNPVTKSFILLFSSISIFCQSALILCTLALSLSDFGKQFVKIKVQFYYGLFPLIESKKQGNQSLSAMQSNYKSLIQLLIIMQIQIQKPKIKPFTLYQLDKNNSNARCCYESEYNKIICTVVGPQFDTKSTKLVPVIKIIINGADVSILDNERLKQILMQVIVIQNYPKSIFQYNIEVLEQSIALFPCLVNLLFYTNVIAGINQKDIFCASMASIVNNEIMLEPSKTEQKNSRSVLVMTILRRSKRSIHFALKGQCSIPQMNKMIEYCLSSTDIIGKYMQEKLQKQVLN